MWHEETSRPAPICTMLVGAIAAEDGTVLLLGEVWKGLRGWYWQDCTKPLKTAPTHWCHMPSPPNEIERIRRHPD